MRTNTLITFFTIFLSLWTNAQNFEWVKSFGSGASEVGYSVTLDASGNVYTTGYFVGTVDFDPGPGTADLTSQGSRDIFVQKLDASGNFIWAKSFGGNSNDAGISISVDVSGNVYTTGYFAGTADFDPGVGTDNLTSAGSQDVFVQKLDASGNFIWAKSFGGNSYDTGNSITLDASGYVYTTGYFVGTVDFDPGTGTANQTSVGGDDIFIQKLDASGNFIWAKSFGGSSTDQGRSVSVDATGNVYTTGFYIGTVDFNPGAGITNLVSTGGYDIFVQKLDASGNFVWANSFGSSSNDFGQSIAVGASGNVYTTGYFQGTVDFDPGAGTDNHAAAGNYDVFVQKLDASGNYIWAKSFGGTLNDVCYSIAVDASGNTYTTGNFQGTADFDPGIGTANLTSVGDYDIFTQKLDASGNFLWSKSFGGILQDDVRSISLDASENVYTTGYFYGGGDYDPGTGVSSLTSIGGSDIFVHKMSPCSPTTGIDVQTACDSYTWIDGNTYAASNNTATWTLTNAAGCDSVVTLDLTINSSNTGTDVQTACDSYTWIDGNTYTTSNNTATWTLTNTAGCDSVVTLDLTINNSNTGTDVQTACDSYTWIDGNTYASSNNTATFTLTNAAGCDSVVTLDLTILNSSSGTDVQTACDSYTWIDGNTYTTSNNTATWTLTNAAGCDSLVTLDLTIINVSDINTSVNGLTITADNANASYVWLDCDDNYSILQNETAQSYTATANGNYAVELTENGCVDTSLCVAITTVGIIENNFENNLLVYPNPTDGYFSIDLGAIYSNSQVLITDMSGKLIDSQIIPQSQVLNLSIKEPAGIYIVSIQAGDKKAVIRLVKE